MSKHVTAPTERFTETVQDYVKYRPSYPHEVLQTLIDECGLTKQSVIADVGSGTGFLAKLFLEHGNTVYGVEPNQPMREAAESYLKEFPHFHSIDASAESTTLEDKSVDFVTAGTAFHWFDAPKTKVEFNRILKPSGWVLLVWNVRNMEQSPLIQDYEKLIMDYGTDYKVSNARKFDKMALQKGFFDFHEMKTKSFKNIQYFDWEGFKGRLLSTSYSLRPGDEKYDEMMDALRKIFEKYQVKGKVEFLYETKLYYGLIA